MDSIERGFDVVPEIFPGFLGVFLAAGAAQVKNAWAARLMTWSSAIALTLFFMMISKEVDRWLPSPFFFYLSYWVDNLFGKWTDLSDTGFFIVSILVLFVLPLAAGIFSSRKLIAAVKWLNNG